MDKQRKIDLKKAETKDVPKLIEIEKSVASKTYSAIVTEKDWQDELVKNNAKIFTILSNDEIIGDVSYEIKSDCIAYISGLCIKQKFRSQGIGKEVIKLILKELKDYKRIELVTHPENKNAIKLYSSFGFLIEKQMENYFGDGEPRILMVKINN